MKDTIYVKVVGVTFEGRQEKIATLTRGKECILIPEPENRYDQNALAVWAQGETELLHVGYIPREMAALLAPYLEGERITAIVYDITGGFEFPYGGTAALGLVVMISLPGLSDVMRELNQ